VGLGKAMVRESWKNTGFLMEVMVRNFVKVGGNIENKNAGASSLGSIKSALANRISTY